MRIFKYTEKETAAIKSMYQDGINIQQIAERVGRTYEGVKDLLSRVGVKRKKEVNAYTDEEISTIRRLVGLGKSFSEIGEELGRSRGSIAGRVRREGIKAEKKPNRNKKTKASEPEAFEFKRHNRKKGTKVSFKPDIFVPENERRNLLERHDNQCCWPLGDPLKPDFHYCNRSRTEGSSYCEHHSKKMSYKPLEPYREKPLYGRTFIMSVDAKFDE